MLKKTVQFVDFDGANKTKNIYFNLTRSEVIDNVEIRDEFQEIHDLISGEERDLEIHEVKLILGLVKKLMQMSYGVQKQVDGDLVFSKRSELWENFTETAAYDAFLMSLFEQPGEALDFLFGIWPKELTQNLDREQLELQFDKHPPKEFDASTAPDKPAIHSEPVDTESTYTKEALLAMPQAEFDFIVGTDPLKMSREHLQIAMQRKTRGN